MNFYKSIDDAGKSNSNLILNFFKNYKIFLPKSKFSSFDGIVYMKNIYHIIEVKRRQFSNEYLLNKYNGELMLEKEKIDKLINEKIKFENLYKSKKFKCWYISKTNDGYIYIFDISTYDNINFIKMNIRNRTYGSNIYIKEKIVAFLNIKDAIYIKKTKILN